MNGPMDEATGEADINLPEVVAQVRSAFDRYNAALEAGSAEALNGFFWDSPHTVRFGVGEHLYGYNAIANYRNGAWQKGPQRILDKVVVTTIGREFAVTSAVFRSGPTTLSRQSQTWTRRPEGWRIISAHVSILKG
jgi:hypothetical protein